MSEKKQTAANFYSDKGQVAMSMIGFRRQGRNLVMVGKLMGAWESDIIIYPEEMLKAIILGLNRSVIGYVFSLPFLLLKKNKE